MSYDEDEIREELEGIEDELQEMLSEHQSELETLLIAYLVDHGWTHVQEMVGGYGWTRKEFEGWWQRERNANPNSNRYVTFATAISEQILYEQGKAGWV